MKRLIKFLTGCACLFLVCSCSSEAGEELPTPNERKDIILTISEEEVVKDYNEFALKFFSNDMSRHNINSIISPLSASRYLSIMANGAVGETRDEILAALGFDSEELDVANAFFYRLTKELESLDNTVDITIANSIWIDNSFDVNPTFINNSRTSYGAEIFREPIPTDETAKKIYDWVINKTNGQITNRYSEDKGYILLGGPIASFDALNFKGRWNIPFDKSLTKKDKFTNFDGSKSEVEMMHGKFDCKIAFDGDAYWLTLPYGNGAFEMKLVLPKDVLDRVETGEEEDGVKTYLMKDGDEALNEYFASLTPEKFSSLLVCGDEYSIDLSLPKFDLRSVGMLPHTTLGIEKAFDCRYADFSNISTQKDIACSSIVQLSHFSVDEAGTAGAIVSREITYIMPGEHADKPVIESLEFNKPFAFIIRERSTGAILFMGRIGSLGLGL